MNSVNEAVEVYERLRKAATERVVSSGCENLSFGLSSWKVLRNPDTQSVDLHITYILNSAEKHLTINWRELELYVRGENQVIKMSRTITKKIQERIAEHVASNMTGDVYRGCAQQLVRLK